MSFQLFYISEGFFVDFFFLVLFQISGILNIIVRVSMESQAAAVTDIYTDSVWKKSLSINCREKTGLYWGYSEWGGEIDSSSGQMSLLEKAIDVFVDGNSDQQPHRKLSRRKTFKVVCKWDPRNYGFMLGGLSGNSLAGNVSKEIKTKPFKFEAA